MPCLLGVDGYQMFGLNQDVVVYLIEKLPGARNCFDYKFKYHSYSKEEKDVVSK